MRLIVCGGRNYRERERVFHALDRIAGKCGMSMLIHGGASGADSLAAEWCALRRIPETAFPADWSHGPKAGPLRNQRMIDEGKPDGLVAFPGGRGTADMIRRAQMAGLKIWRPFG